MHIFSRSNIHNATDLPVKYIALPVSKVTSNVSLLMMDSHMRVATNTLIFIKNLVKK